ncbi:MAG: dihydrodipicolinate synthase family protein [Rhodoferax sp.]|nr:dihydrodipicolinate synthase family protein [Rhodoferax sp.]HRA61713.1 dihydrodipicolinate synthase family protein [Burkholderiaceae bacterium]
MNQDMNGLWPALLTPVSKGGELDTARMLAHARHMLDSGCDGVTIFGTTSEGPAFTNAERKALLEALIASGVLPDQIVVTTSCSALADAIDLGRHAIAQGCLRQLFMPPFYFRNPRAAGIIESVSTVVRGIADDRLKLLLYHIPGLSSVVFSHASIQTLVERHPGVVIGVKDSSGELAHGLALAKAFPGLCILSGAEQYVAQIMCAGGSGSINGLGNISPALMARIIARPQQVDAQDARLVLDLLALLSLRPGTNFVNVYKTMLAEQTGDDTWLNVRAPLCPLEPEEEQAVRAAYRAIGAALARV